MHIHTYIPNTHIHSHTYGNAHTNMSHMLHKNRNPKNHMQKPPNTPPEIVIALERENQKFTERKRKPVPLFPVRERVRERAEVELSKVQHNSFALFWSGGGCVCVGFLCGMALGWGGGNITKIVIDTKFMMCSGCVKNNHPPPKRGRLKNGVGVGVGGL